ncbi:MAG: GatB/YqeY domain-containing protein [Gammaproteobacteria bacterium]|nr:GatB/YqeY domain-containing protein [Gammaproteobacteria bacterium]MCH9743990.1 GatB/YqeY domain-containing protein [Gammaproteobacteria bacterium]
MDTLKSKIQEDMKDAMRAKEKLRLTTIRMLIAAIKQREIDDRTELDEAGVLAIINKLIKQRRESAQQYQEAKRQDLADQELEEIKILQVYLPEQLSEAEVAEAVSKAVAATGATTPKDIGKVMGALKAEIQGKADMGLVSKLVRDSLLK